MKMEERAFELSGVIHLVRPAGLEVRDLEELRVALGSVPERSLFYHTNGRLLRHPASEELPSDDVSRWVYGVVQDRETAERLSFAVESSSSSADDLRRAFVEVLDGVSERDRTARAAPPGGEFVFLTAESVPVPSGDWAVDPWELLQQLADADASVWFYHLIEQPWSHPGPGALIEWLRSGPEPRIANWLEEAARSGRTLEEMRERVVRRWRMRRLGRRVADAVGAPENERREAGRAAVSKLFRRITRAGEEQA